MTWSIPPGFPTNPQLPPSRSPSSLRVPTPPMTTKSARDARTVSTGLGRHGILCLSTRTRPDRTAVCLPQRKLLDNPVERAWPISSSPLLQRPTASALHQEPGRLRRPRGDRYRHGSLKSGETRRQFFRKRLIANSRTVIPMIASAANCLESASSPAPFRNTARTISM